MGCVGACCGCVAAGGDSDVARIKAVDDDRACHADERRQRAAASDGASAPDGTMPQDQLRIVASNDSRVSDAVSAGLSPHPASKDTVIAAAVNTAYLFLSNNTFSFPFHLIKMYNKLN